MTKTNGRFEHLLKPKQSSKLCKPYLVNTSVELKKSWWKSSTVWLCIIGLVGIVGVPSFAYYLTPNINSIDFTDVSSSNQTNSNLLEEHCRNRIGHLKEGDVALVGKFADQPTKVADSTYEERNRLKLQEECKQAATVPLGLGDRKGTSLMFPLERIQDEVRHLRTLGNSQRTALTLVIQAAEPSPNLPVTDPKRVKEILQEITKDGSAVAIIGPQTFPDQDLQKQLTDITVNVKNTRICTFSDDKECMEWAFNRARWGN